jgi:hypothetical protein
LETSAFEIISFEGALPLRFGMSPDEVIQVVGPPRSSGPGWKKMLNYNYYSPDLNLNVGFGGEGQTADHFGFGRGSTVFFEGLDLFGDPAAWRAVVERSRDCHEWVGFIICCDLGIQFSGFHDQDESQLAVVAFPRGTQEKHRTKFRPYQLHRDT